LSEELAIIEGEIVEHHTSLNLFGVQEPEEVVVKAASVAKALAKVVRKQKLATSISGREYVRVEGWTLLGSMLGVFPYCVWTRKLDDGWEARVEARTRDGSVIGSAEAQCLYAEKTWKSRDDYALRSMAQTRATSKALRQPLGFVMTLAGFDATPAEEMPTAAPAAPFASSEATEEVPLITSPQAKKLDVLVGQLRQANRLTTEQLYTACHRDALPGEDGLVHWAPLRESLSKQEASDLIERLEKYEKALREEAPF
jgi:hypothetical protein